MTIKQTPWVLMDWGNTLRRDEPGAQGPMCNWIQVSAMPSAVEAVHYLAEHCSIAVATGATNSNEQQVIQALARVGLSSGIDTVFLASRLGVSKATPQFYLRIAERLALAPQQLVMIGDNLEQDVRSAEQAGLHAFWVPVAVEPSHMKEHAYTLMDAARHATAILKSAS